MVVVSAEVAREILVCGERFGPVQVPRRGESRVGREVLHGDRRREPSRNTRTLSRPQRITQHALVLHLRAGEPVELAARAAALSSTTTASPWAEPDRRRNLGRRRHVAIVGQRLRQVVGAVPLRRIRPGGRGPRSMWRRIGAPLTPDTWIGLKSGRIRASTRTRHGPAPRRRWAKYAGVARTRRRGGSRDAPNSGATTSRKRRRPAHPSGEEHGGSLSHQRCRASKIKGPPPIGEGPHCIPSANCVTADLPFRQFQIHGHLRCGARGRLVFEVCGRIWKRCRLSRESAPFGGQPDRRVMVPI
jgi:hypothetical protein